MRCTTRPGPATPPSVKGRTSGEAGSEEPVLYRLFVAQDLGCRGQEEGAGLGAARRQGRQLPHQLG